MASILKHHFGWSLLPMAGWLLSGLLAGADRAVAIDATNAPVKHDRAFVYYNDVLPAGPWSIHIVRIQRAHPEFEFFTTLGNGGCVGMSTVQEQVKALPHELGQPMAAINGDFYDKSDVYEGVPRDLQIRRGELIRAPAAHTCFWMDPQGHPQMTNIYSRLRVMWPDNRTGAIGLNQERKADTAVLYTAAIGRSTRTHGGLELVLECAPANPLPLRAGQTYDMSVRTVSTAGDTPLDPHLVVLSLGPKLAGQFSGISSGARLRIFTDTVPDLSGVQVAIGGGPALVKDGKAMEWSGFILMRHPRSALGWNQDYIFLVEVDGRQLDLSIGMTFPELADYLLKLGCQQAMNFDGGGSATLWALGDVRNSPSEGQERPAANALVILKKPTLAAVPIRKEPK